MIIAITKKKRITPVLRPHIIELRRIPKRLIRQLRHADRMGSRAGASGLEGFFCSAVHVVLVVGGVEVLAVPA
jgi:hypothetical protein